MGRLPIFCEKHCANTFTCDALIDLTLQMWEDCWRWRQGVSHFGSGRQNRISRTANRNGTELKIEIKHFQKYEQNIIKGEYKSMNMWKCENYLIKQSPSELLGDFNSSASQNPETHQVSNSNNSRDYNVLQYILLWWKRKKSVNIFNSNQNNWTNEEEHSSSFGILHCEVVGGN